MKKYVLYGCGLEGEKFLYKNFYMKEQIAYCIDVFHKGEFHGIPIYNIEEAENLERYKILVAAIWETYLKIKEILETYGLKEFSNFMWASEFNKKIIGINANCHGLSVKEYLENCPEFAAQYIIHPIPQVHMNDKREINVELLRNLDVYIHQDIRKDNAYGYKLSDEYTVAHLKEGCQDIVIPNFVGMGGWLFPQIRDASRTLKMLHGEGGIFLKDLIMEEAFDKGMVAIEDYIEFYNTYSYPSEFLAEEYKKYIHKMREREQNWSIKIVDWIIDNFRKVPCFVDHGHASSYLMYEVGRQVALLLGITALPDISKLQIRLGTPSPMPKNVKDYFNMAWEWECDKPKNFLGDYDSVENLAGYIRGYLWWYHGIVVGK
uniref:WcbI family polysaccharide biosynthesis putative acetyltransferase n=1 Tax=Acetatifactor sp. TaxID=1872090 RepID=UPI0040572634